LDGGITLLRMALADTIHDQPAPTIVVACNTKR
jgi:hypothetical protein